MKTPAVRSIVSSFGILATIVLAGRWLSAAPAPPFPLAQTYTLHGTIKEDVYSSLLGKTIPVANAEVRVIDGPDTDRITTSAADGSYILTDMHAATVTFRITKEGYQVSDTTITIPNTLMVNTILRRECEAWPPEIATHELIKLPILPDVCLVTFIEDGEPSEYVSDIRTVFYSSPAPVGGQIGSLAHELGHIHQHRVVLDAGLPEPTAQVRGDFLSKWVSTPEGMRFLELTGWTHDPSSPPYAGWVEQCERWSCGYPNPLEDAATFTASWYYPGSLGGILQQVAPLRFQWAQQYLPLIVPIMVTITGQPASQSVSEGQTAMFTVFTNEGSMPGFQWQVSTNDGMSWTNVAYAPPHSGVTTPTLTVTSAPLTLNGAQYRAVVFNGVGSVTSDAASLAVTAFVAAPTITAHPADQTVAEGDSASFSVEATGSPAYQWQISTDGGESWTDVSNVAPYSGATSATLTITGVTGAFSGAQYRAIATNSAGSAASDAATLTVSVLPTFGHR